MANIFVTLPINVSANPDIIENVHIDAKSSPKYITICIALLKESHNTCACSYILGIVPHIIEHGTHISILNLFDED